MKQMIYSTLVQNYIVIRQKVLLKKADVLALYKKQFEHLDSNTFDYIFSDNDWYDKLEEFVAQEEAKKGHYSPEQIKEMLNKVNMAGYEKLNEIINTMSSKINRIACLTVKNDNLPMWTHYANNNAGVCIEYDTTTIENILILNRLFPVDYQCNVLDGVSYLFENNKDQSKLFSFLDRLAVRKLEDWKYEQEWRLILNMGHLYYSPQYTDKGQLYYFTKPSKVFLGCKITELNEKKIRDVCELNHISVIKMNITPYGLKATDTQNIGVNSNA